MAFVFKLSLLAGGVFSMCAVILFHDEFHGRTKSDNDKKVDGRKAELIDLVVSGGASLMHTSDLGKLTDPIEKDFGVGYIANFSRSSVKNDVIAEVIRGFPIVSLKLRGTSITDVEFAQLNTRHVRLLAVDNTRLTQKSIDLIARCVNLKELTLRGLLTKEELDLAPLGKVETLEILDASKNKIKAKTLRVGASRKLKELYLRESNIDNDHLLGLQGLASLTVLDISSTRIGRGFVRHIKQNKDLAFIGLSSTKVEDDDLGDLTKLTKLSTIRLEKTAVTDKGIALLGQLSALRCLDLDGTNVTRQAMKRLRDQIPDLSISPNPDD